MNLPPDIVAAFAPTGTLRASINLGNPILAATDAASGEPDGVSVDLARGLAERLGVAIELMVFERPASRSRRCATEQADIGFFAIDPVRGEGIAFTAPYVLIEGSYLVRDGSPLQQQRGSGPGRHPRVVGQGSAYDLYLTRELKQAHDRARAESPSA